MSYTYSRTAANCPTVLAPAPSSFTLGNGSSGYFPTNAGASSSLMNQIQAALNLLGQGPGGGYYTFYGLDLSSPSGLNVAVSAGLAWIGFPVELTGSTPLGLQKAIPGTYTLANNTVNFVWLTNIGTLIAGTTTTPPSGGLLYLGAVTTASGAVTGIDYSARCYINGSFITRTTADTVAPGDTPSANVQVMTITANGNYLWDGISHKRLVDPAGQLYTPYTVKSVSASFSIPANGPNLYVLTPTTTGITVTLPAATALTPGHTFTIQNTGTHSLSLNNSSGSTLCTITAGAQVTVYPYYSGGSLTFSSSYSPVTIGTAIPTI